jgi:putative glutamine amidotransferase
VDAPPLVGITAGNDPNDGDFYVLRWDYVRCVEAAGGVPVVLAPSGPALHSSLLERLDALILTGGVDIHPSCYGEEPHPTVTRTSAIRDEFELRLLADALKRDVPVLGICRGSQMLNVALGGSLIQDIPSTVPGHASHDDRQRTRATMAHRVEVDPSSRLAGILERTHFDVNSFHHQAAHRLGRGLVVSALAEDGVVEGIELPSARFVMGIQWHPEAFLKSPELFGRIFGALVAARHPSTVH